jgi:hypothetical protein
MDRALLEKYFKNNCTNEELNYILEWFRISGESNEAKALFWKMWLDLPEDEQLRKPDDKLLDKLHHKINLMNSRTGHENKIEKSFFQKDYINVFAKVAAVLLFPIISLLLLISYKYHNNRHELLAAGNSYNEVYSSVDAITKLTLPDGTVVWLNHNSRLKYPSVFSNKSRSVELSGEGYFEVVTNPSKPFVVNAGEILAIARGTTFNILAYPGEDRIETSLLKGEVELQKKKGESQINIAEMEPTDLIIYQKSSKDIIMSHITDERNYAWKDGKLIFKKEPLVNVEAKLERWFNVDIEINDQRLYELSFTATFVNETLMQVLEFLSIAAPFNYDVSKREALEDGSYSKRKVILTYKAK